jgi:hypothetical protein
MHNHQNSKPGGRTFAEGVAQLNRESGGLLRVEIIRPQDVFALSCAVFSGDGRALARLTAALESSERIRRMARKSPAICLTCPRAVRDPQATLAILAPENDAATVTICSAICARCSTGSASEVLKRAATAYTTIWPNLRCVEITHPAGHA